MSMYGYGTPPPRDFARIARNLEFTLCFVTYVHSEIIDIIADNPRDLL